MSFNLYISLLATSEFCWQVAISVSVSGAELSCHRIHRELAFLANHMQTLVQNCGFEAPNIADLRQGGTGNSGCDPR